MGPWFSRAEAVWQVLDVERVRMLIQANPINLHSLYSGDWMWFCLDWTSPPFVDLFVSAPGRPRMWFCDILCIYLATATCNMSINKQHYATNLCATFQVNVTAGTQTYPWLDKRDQASGSCMPLPYLSMPRIPHRMKGTFTGNSLHSPIFTPINDDN